MIIEPVMRTTLKSLFVTEKNNDVIEIYRHIENLDQSVEKYFHIGELQATMLQTLHDDNVAQDAILSKLINAENNLTSNLNKVTKEMENQSIKE